MSENLDLVRSMYADWERRDFMRGDWADPNIEYTAFLGVTLGAPARGIGVAAMAQTVRENLSPLEGFRIEAVEFREMTDARILVLERRTARGRLSGMAMQTNSASVFDVSEGRVTKFVTYQDADLALADLGLTE